MCIIMYVIYKRMKDKTFVEYNLIRCNYFSERRDICSTENKKMLFITHMFLIIIISYQTS